MNTETNERRSFIRHAVDIPVRVYPQEEDSRHKAPLSDVGEGGLAFLTNVAFEKGAQLKIDIYFTQPPFEALCVVCWQRDAGAQFEVGVKFLDENSAFRSRMVEQLCSIEDYCKRSRESGRQLSREELAREWIEHYAANFDGCSHE
jgi:hypothetical protein